MVPRLHTFFFGISKQHTCACQQSESLKNSVRNADSGVEARLISHFGEPLKALHLELNAVERLFAHRNGVTRAAKALTVVLKFSQ